MDTPNPRRMEKMQEIREGISRTESPVREPDDKANQPRLATSEDIPRAVEFLIHFVVRWTCFGLAAIFGLLSIAAWSSGWTWWVAIPLSMFTFAAIVGGAATRPQGNFQWDRTGPSIIVPASRSDLRQRSDDEQREGHVPGRDHPPSS